jgi:hypothetical protein
MYAVHVSECEMCNTAAYSYLSDEDEGSGTHECTSGYTIHGGGPCCAPLHHWTTVLTDSGKGGGW